MPWAPIGAIVAQPELADTFTPGSHATTFGANPLVVSAAIAMFETMVHYLSIEHLNGYSYDPPAGQGGYARLLNDFRRPHATLDGFMAVLPYSAGQWRAFFGTAERLEVLDDPRFWHHSDHPSEGPMISPSFPVRYGGPQGDATPAGPAPQLGEHTFEVLQRAGMQRAEIDELVKAGVARVPQPAAPNHAHDEGAIA